MSKRFAMTLVVEGEDVDKVWEDVGATLGDGNNLLEDGHSAVFLGDLFQIVEKDEYNSGQVAYVVLSGVQRLRDGLPVRVHDGEALRSALDQIQDVAMDGKILADEAVNDPAIRLAADDFARAVQAKLERIANIAEVGEPDEDRAVAKEHDAGDPDHCPKCGSGAIAANTSADGDWACLDCDAKFYADDPSEVDGPRREEGKDAALDALATAKRRPELVQLRVDWLCKEGWDVQAGDYKRGEIDLTELLRRLHDQPEVVQQIATWLEEDAAEPKVAGGES